MRLALCRVPMPVVAARRAATLQASCSSRHVVQARQITTHSRQGFLQHRVDVGCRRQFAPPPPPPPTLPPRTTVRCMASKGGGDKSWTDIAREAGELAT